MRPDAKTREGEFYAYELAYPENMGGAVFYVGKGSGQRIDEHEKETKRGGDFPRHIIIRQIWEAGEQIVKRKVQENITQDMAFELEKQLIKKYGPENLSNWTIWQKDSTPDDDAPIQTSLYLKGELRDQIKACLALEGIPFSRVAINKYVQDICFQALHEHVQEKLTG